MAKQAEEQERVINVFRLTTTEKMDLQTIMQGMKRESRSGITPSAACVMHEVIKKPLADMALFYRRKKK